MDTRKDRRSPRREYTRSSNNYSSPNRRNHGSRSRSRSLVHRRHFSPVDRKHMSRSSPKRRKSRSRSPSGVFRRGFFKERDMYSIRRSRSSERKSRKSDTSIKKPLYRGPENAASLGKAVTSPVRVVLVQRKGEGKSPVYSDEKLATQKQSSSNDRSRTVPDDNEPGKMRILPNESEVNIKSKKGFERRAYTLKITKHPKGTAAPNYSERRNMYDDQSSPIERSSPRNNYNYSSRRPYVYNANSHRKESDSSRGYKNYDHDRSSRLRKSPDRKFTHRQDKSYADEEQRSHRSHSSNRRDGSRERHHCDRHDDRKQRRRRKESDHHYSHYSNHREFDENNLSNEEHNDLPLESEFENKETEEFDEASNNCGSGNLIPGIALRPPPIGLFPRPMIPLAPLPVPPFRGPPLLPRFYPPFLPRPFRFPIPRIFPPNRFYPPVPPTY